MTVPNYNLSPPFKNHHGNGVVTTFDFDFLINKKSELRVYLTNTLGGQTTLTLNVDYSIHEIGNPNGSYITFPIKGSTYDVLSSDEVLSNVFVGEIEQLSPFSNSDNLNLSNLEFSFDYITRLIQMLYRQIERSVKTKEGSGVNPDVLIQELLEAKIASIAAKDAILNDSGFIAISADLEGDNTIGVVATDLVGADTIGTVAANITDINNAASNAASALASRNKAEKWAEENENVEVEAGKYSAKHYAAKAALFDPARLIKKDGSVNFEAHQSYSSGVDPVDITDPADALKIPSAGDVNSALDGVDIGLPTGWIHGFMPSNNPTSPDTVLDFTGGKCRSDDDTVDIELSAGSIDFATNGVGGLDTGSLDDEKWYYCYVISKDNGADPALLTSLSDNSPTMPVGYTKKRKIGVVQTNDSSELKPISVAYMNNNLLRYSTDDVTGYQQQNPGVLAVLFTVAAPPNCLVFGIYTQTYGGGTAPPCSLLTEVSQEDVEPSPGVHTLYGIFVLYIPHIRCDGSSQLRSRLNYSHPSAVVSFKVYGFYFER